MKKICFYLVLVSGLALAACKAAPEPPLSSAPSPTPSPAPTQTAPGTTEIPTLTDTPIATPVPLPAKAGLLALLTDKSGTAPAASLYLDMNGDGRNELIAVVLTGYQYDVWYVNSDGTVCECVFEKSDYYDECAIAAIPYEDQLHVAVNYYNLLGANKSFSVFALQNDTIVPLIANHYGTAGTGSDSLPCVTVDDYDGYWDPMLQMNTMHTWKTTYIQYDKAENCYKELTARKISETEFLAFTNGKEILDAALSRHLPENSLRTENEFFIRENGILHIQCYIHDTGGGITNYYYTFTYDGSTITSSVPDFPEYGIMYEKLTGLEDF